MELATTCRCCLSNDTLKDLNTIYFWQDKKEIYGDMLFDCFNINLTPSYYNGICNMCISSLRTSMQFKQSVLDADREFAKRLEECGEDKKFEIKEEPVFSDSDEGTSDDYFLADAVKEETIEVCIDMKKEDSPPKIQKHKNEPKKDAVSYKIQKIANVVKKEDKQKKIKLLVNRLANSISSLPGITIKKNGSKTHSSSTNMKIVKIAPSTEMQGNPKNLYQLNEKILDKCLNQKILDKCLNQKILDKCLELPAPSEVKDKHINNLRTIMKCSNCTPFKGRNLLGYICAYCDRPFPDPADLRTHTSDEHKNKTTLNMKWEHNTYAVKMDITDLKCLLCDAEMDNLKTLREHLVSAHDKVIYSDIKDHIVQFRLKKGDVYDCCMCTARYETFKSLTQHMNSHYRNFDCPKCDSSFTTKRSLIVHSAIHKEGTFKCNHCDKVFSTLVKKRYHERCSHEKRNRVSPCPYCKQEFSSYYMKNVHLTKFHNIDHKYKCNVCFKTFILKNLLMQHIKKQHLMEKNVICSVCGHKFFSSKGLKNHMLKHTGEKNYKCHVCNKAYGRKYTLSEHLRIHNNDRRFRCEVCAMTFVQKCSLKSHLLSNHGISLSASEITASGRTSQSVESEPGSISPC